MAFDQPTRNRLAKFVGDARSLLSGEFTRQLQHEYGLDPASGEVTPLERLTALDDARLETARILRETLDYYLAGQQVNAKNRKNILARIVREQAFTVLNRLCALRMAEGRGLLIESIGRGYQSKGFLLYARLAGSALGETGEAYKSYLFSIFDEFAVDLPALFDRLNPEGRLFPRENKLLELLDLINDPDIDPLWVEDETIGWIYQYFNSQEERKQMRAESSAPRNSRELAVRNQFFTPRYVVEFLTDNTLGRIWYEMTKGETALKDTCRYLVRRPNEIFLDEGQEAPQQDKIDEDLSQEEMLKQPVYIPHRTLKDPREIKMLDPACGSMHFGLYAFDLFEQIYEEAWEIEEKLGQDALWRLANLDALHDTYPDKTVFLQDVPRQIIERNIHGIDIDPRAAQIAGLSLWLRAQKNWQAQCLQQTQRPSIRKSNIVCAEPMPGGRKMLEEFLTTLREDRLDTLIHKTLHLPAEKTVRTTKAMADALANLVRLIWQEMELAGEAGSLLKIEETLSQSIAQARQASADKAPLFHVLEFGMENQAGEKREQPSTSSPVDFWSHAGDLVLGALQEYSELSQNGEVYRHKLFAEDAVRGFAFIDLCQKRYDVALMNPPFGTYSVNLTDWIKNSYPITYSNLGAVFVERSAGLLETSGGLGIIIDISTSIRSSYDQYRYGVLYSRYTLSTYLPLGWDVLDANVEVCCFSAMNTLRTDRTIFCLDASNQKDKHSLIDQCISAINIGQRDPRYFIANQDGFESFPNGVPNFSIPMSIISLFSRGKHLDPTFADVRTGLSTGDNERFYKLAWEIQPGNNWFYLSNGGIFSSYYRPSQEVINWDHDGREITEYRDKAGKLKSRPQNLTYCRKPGLTYGKRGEYISVHTHPSNRYFTNEGQGIFPHDEELRYSLLALLNSKLLRALLNEYCGQHKENGYVSLLPIVITDLNLSEILTSCASQVIGYLRSMERNRLEHAETSMPKFAAFSNLNEYVESIKKQLEKLQDDTQIIEDRINLTIFNSLGIDEEGRKWVSEKTKSMPTIFDSVYSFGWREKELVSEVFDYLVGIIFGRWDLRLAMSSEDDCNSMDPFDPLPQFPFGMLLDHQGSPANVKVIKNYPLRISWEGILDVSNSKEDDIESRIREVLNLIWPDAADQIELDVSRLLDTPTLHEFFQNPSRFFDDHLNRYSKGRRSAPIYWPLSTPSNSYTLWLYYHRINDQILFTCVNDFVDQKLKQVSEEATQLRTKKSRSAADEKELERLSDFERELKDFRAELLRVAAFWKPNLNDGVQITAAPLWKLFQHKPWRKKLKETWEKLERGDYDWAHLAYSIWPERVREKCKTDKSLAIAHDLEHLYHEPKMTKKKKGKPQVGLQLEDILDEE